MHAVPGQERNVSDDEEEAEDSSDTDDEAYYIERYPGAVKKDPALRKRKRTEPPKPVASKRPRKEPTATPMNRDTLLDGAARNAARVAQGAKPRGRPKKITPDLDAASDEPATAEDAGGRTWEAFSESAGRERSPRLASEEASSKAPQLAGPSSSLQQQPHPAMAAVSAPVRHSASLPPASSGFQRNLDREMSGKPKRGRPLGVKNKPKPALDSMEADSVNGERAGGSSGEAE